MGNAPGNIPQREEDLGSRCEKRGFQRLHEPIPSASKLGSVSMLA